MNRSRLKGLTLTLVLMNAAAAVRAAVLTFTGAGDWTDPGRWSGGTLPANGDDVTIAGNVTLTNTTPVLGSCTLNAGFTNTFFGTNTLLRATNVTLYGTVTHGTNLAAATNVFGIWEVSNVVSILAFSNVTIEAGGQINVDGRGFQGGPAYPQPGRGPGGGKVERAGASYGGIGGKGFGAALAGPTYGSALAPLDPGSGGGSGGAQVGGAGGGAVRIEAAGRVHVNGTVSANGLVTPSAGGSGSGGGVHITCGSFDGSGVIRAAGGISQGATAGGGGGGRIAIHYTNAAAQTLLSPTVQFVLGGRMGRDVSYAVAQPGTLYLTNTNFWPTTYATLAGGGQITIPGFTTWNPGSLTLTNSGLQFPDGFTLAVAGNVAVTNGGELILTNAAFSCGGNLIVERSSASLVLRDHSTLDCAGDLVISNAGLFFCHAGVTNAAGSPFAIRVGVTGALDVGAWLYTYSHSTNGGSSLFEAGSLSVAAGAQINADGGGFRGGLGTPYTAAPGCGPGGGKAERAGGSHGGSGGNGLGAAAAGPLYGLADEPADPGSGGGSGNGQDGRSGGGLVRLHVAGAATVDGAITADGGTSGGGGGGSGGSVHLRCDTVRGTGVVRARGSAAGLNGGGGGGRIAIVYTNLAAQQGLTPTLQFDLKGGSGSTVAQNGRRGTLHLSDASFFPKESLTGHYALTIPGFTNWAPNSLTITNGSLQFPAGFVCSVTQAVTLATNSALEVRESVTLNCGSLRLADGCNLDLYAGPTNASLDYGCLVDVTGELLLESNAFIYPYSDTTNGGSPWIRVKHLTVAAGASIDANAKGFPAATNDYGWGFGPGASRGTYGASHVVRGGPGYYSGAYGSTYDSSNAPAFPGSGAGKHWGPYTGGAGGGLIRVTASGTVTLHGTLTANATAGNSQGGGGAGGGIHVRCRRFRGAASGALWANGGNSGTNTTDGGSGAGGSIAVWRVRDDYLGTASATNGDAYVTHLGEPGTIVWGWLLNSGTLFTIN